MERDVFTYLDKDYRYLNNYIKDINEFYKTYGIYGNYVNSHHLTFDELPDEIKPRAEQAITLANKVKALGFIKPSQDHINKIHTAVIAEKVKNGGYVKAKLK